MKIICTSQEYDKTIQKLTAAEVKFREVTLTTATGKKPAIELEEDVFLRILVGCLISQN